MGSVAAWGVGGLTVPASALCQLGSLLAKAAADGWDVHRAVAVTSHFVQVLLCFVLQPQLRYGVVWIWL